VRGGESRTNRDGRIGGTVSGGRTDRDGRIRWDLERQQDGSGRQDSVRS
jgi:hypothetical protein